MSDQKTTYASLALTEDDHRKYEDAIKDLTPQLPEKRRYCLIPHATSKSEKFMPDTNPAYPWRSLARIQVADATDINVAVRCAKDSIQALTKLGWEGRLEILKRASILVEHEKHNHAALLTHEIGKVRAEGIAEALEVPAMIEAYTNFTVDANAYSYTLSEGKTAPYEYSICVQRPLGGPVAVIVPFNFPFALAANHSIAAILAGNPVVFKPSEDAPLATLAWRNTLVAAGLPPEACPVVFGPGETTGEALIRHPDVSLVAFTGSLETGKHIMAVHAELFQKGIYRASPVMEMGGNNPVVVTNNANIATAAEGILRAMVGFGGQKCSKTSRIYAEETAYDTLREALIAMARNGLPSGAKIIVGRPEERNTFLGPLANESAVNRYVWLHGELRRISGISATYLIDEDQPDFARLCEETGGHYARPMLVEGMPHEHALNKMEHFMPVASLHRVKSLEEGVRKANDVEQGLCAGLYSNNRDEKKYFEENIEAGMVYINRPGGATTGSWPTMQNFGGWKGSSTSGVGAFGKWYLLRFTREQDRTRVPQRS